MRNFCLVFRQGISARPRTTGRWYCRLRRSREGPLPRFKDGWAEYILQIFKDGICRRPARQDCAASLHYCGPVGIRTDYGISSQEIRQGVISRTLRNKAWQTTGSVMLTGERNAYSGVRPIRAFEPQKGVRQLGASELALRYSQVRVDPPGFGLRRGRGAPRCENPAVAGARSPESATVLPAPVEYGLRGLPLP
jgi:hypothetical protein